MKKISFWSVLGSILVISSLALVLLIGFHGLNIFWLVIMLPSYLVGFYLYQTAQLKSVYNEDRRFAKIMPSFIFSGGIILAVTFFVGFIFGKIVN